MTRLKIFLVRKPQVLSASANLLDKAKAKANRQWDQQGNSSDRVAEATTEVTLAVDVTTRTALAPTKAMEQSKTAAVFKATPMDLLEAAEGVSLNNRADREVHRPHSMDVETSPRLHFVCGLHATWEEPQPTC